MNSPEKHSPNKRVSPGRFLVVTGLATVGAYSLALAVETTEQLIDEQSSASSAEALHDVETIVLEVIASAISLGAAAKIATAHNEST